MKYVPYMTWKNIEVTHTISKPILVYFEEPDPIYGFKNATIDLDKMLIKQREGFTDEEMSNIIYFCRCNKSLIEKWAKLGGVSYAMSI